MMRRVRVGQIDLVLRPGARPGGGSGERPPGLRPVFSAFSARASSFASYSARSRSRRSRARASITALASAMRARRSSRRAEFLGHRHPGRAHPPHRPPPPTPSTPPPRPPQPGFELAVFPRAARCPARVGVPTLVPDPAATVPSFSISRLDRPGPAAAPRRTAPSIRRRENAAGTRRGIVRRDDRWPR